MNPLQVGVTGGIGAGKSVVCRIFMKLNVPVYDADSRAKYLMTTDKILISGIQKEFGKLSYDKNGELNRAYISEQTFGNAERLERLNQLVHPQVALDFAEWGMDKKGYAYIIKEAALLFESGSYKQLSKTIVVTAPEELRMKRVLNRDGHRTENDIKRIMKSQMDEKAKCKMADYIIHNDESSLVIPQVLKLHETFSKR